MEVNKRYVGTAVLVLGALYTVYTFCPNGAKQVSVAQKGRIGTAVLPKVIDTTGNKVGIEESKANLYEIHTPQGIERSVVTDSGKKFENVQKATYSDTATPGQFIYEYYIGRGTELVPNPEAVGYGANNFQEVYYCSSPCEAK
jgi:hypothetical protein